MLPASELIYSRKQLVRTLSLYETSEASEEVPANMFGTKRGIHFPAVNEFDRARVCMSRRSETEISLLKAIADVSALATIDKGMSENENVKVDCLNLNVGGTSYRISPNTVFKQGDVGLMYRFCTSSHEKRLTLCDEYIEATNEYYFERPASYFDPVYVFYLTGHCYKPPNLSNHVFFDELTYWGLYNKFMPKKVSKKDEKPTKTFSDVRFGKYRKKVWDLFEVPESSIIAKIIAITSIVAVLVSNLGLVMSSMSQFQQNATKIYYTKGNNNFTMTVEEPLPILEHIEMICIVFFSVEYSAKMLAACDRKKTFLEPMNIVDLVAIIPFYLELLLRMAGVDVTTVQDFQGALLVVRILRVLRVIRLFKLGRHSTGLKLFARVVHKSLAQLGMVAVAIGVGIMLFSALVYFAEKDEPNTKFYSIPITFWWAIVTMSTVGYGDMCPETTSGKLLASCAIAAGVLVLSLPITIIVDSFMQVQEEMNLRPAPTEDENVMEAKKSSTVRNPKYGKR